jgi:hypothetical protein
VTTFPQPIQDEERPPIGGALDPAILRVIEALARANARRDYAAAQRKADKPHA